MYDIIGIRFPKEMYHKDIFQSILKILEHEYNYFDPCDVYYDDFFDYGYYTWCGIDPVIRQCVGTQIIGLTGNQ